MDDVIDVLDALTLNGRQVLVRTDDGLAILDLDQNTLTNLNPPTDLCGWISSSPDLTTAVMGCKRTIYILSLQDGTQYPLFTSDEPQLEAYYDQPLWSPDGKWISFFYYNLDSLSHPENRSADTGLYLVDTTCLAEPSTCPEKTRGPFQGDIWMQHPYSWSPDSQSLVMVTGRPSSPFQIFNVRNGTFKALEEVTYGKGGMYPAWSPDGRWIAYSRGSLSEDYSFDIFIMPAEGGAPILLINDEDTPAMFWLTVPFQIGDMLTITEAGVNLNLRAAPALDGTVLQKLQPGDTVTILDGPVEADGYTWWYLQVETDGIEGWAVEDYGWYASVEWDQTSASQPGDAVISSVHVATAEEARVAYETSAVLSINRSISAGQTLELSASEPLLLSSGWCASTSEILAQNDLAMEVGFFVEGVQINPAKYASRDYGSEDPENPTFCRSHYVLLDAWPTGLTCIEVRVDILEPITDGWNEYDPGIITHQYCVSLTTP